MYFFGGKQRSVTFTAAISYKGYLAKLTVAKLKNLVL